MREKPLHLSHFPYYLLKIMLCDTEQYRLGRFLSYSCAVIHSISLLLQMYYLIDNFNKETVSRYGCVVIVTTYCVVALIYEILYAQPSVSMMSQQISTLWPMDACGEKVKQMILKRAFFTSVVTYSILFSFPIFGIIMFPLWGDQSDMFLCVRVFNEYFTKWSKVPIYLYFCSFPVLTFSGIRLPGMLLYAILITNIQIILLNQKIAHISDLGDQRLVFGTLCSCVSLQIKLRQMLNKVLQFVYLVMPVFLLLGALTAISVLFFLFYSLENPSDYLMIRLACFLGGNILVVFTFCESGQALSNDTGRIFDILLTCPWYKWDKKNKNILLMFLVNSLKPMSITIAGITLDYKLAVTLIRTCCSYALVLYQMKN
ncbi:odorant receptor 230 [Tribolium castaneum]|uniref:Odorant receptor n=1 Tax=Tribolium castaneum TaxID=7070 RepID=D6WUR5_TRICA|nr:PREDICTED: uncharacterized protein LOC107398558 [Tribolium castaneum]EFA09300.1 odorant receptor 230 [Tribolium castaneum]|eukprot:XP_015838456.1 PREDICTED: uncharacterized protein LOC107398558 [Tribolium castaneum]